MLLSELFKTATMSPPAEQAVKLGVCSSCHKKALRFIYSCEHFSSWQCTNCLHVYMLESQPTLQERACTSKNVATKGLADPTFTSDIQGQRGLYQCMRSMTYEELVEVAHRFANIHPNEKISLSDVVDALADKRFPFPSRLAQYMATYIDEQMRSAADTVTP